jgi:hypothetical protein
MQLCGIRLRHEGKGAQTGEQQGTAHENSLQESLQNRTRTTARKPVAHPNKKRL